jgi:uncharacterized repeat protein (TIGR02543 family)
MTLYARWNPAYTVSFQSNGGSAVEAQTVAIGGKAVKPTAPTKAAYFFDDWFKEAELTTRWDFYYTVDADMTLYARWKPAKTVTFETNGGSAVEAQSVDPDNPHVIKPEDPAKDGNFFGGWYSDAALTTAWNFSSGTMSEDITLYAKWKTAYTVSFQSNGGTEVEAQTVASGDRVTQPTAPTKDGYLFDGWYSDAAFTTAWNFGYGGDPVSADITLYAKWKTAYTVSFQSNSGSYVVAQTVASGDRVIRPTAPARAGNIFAGWYKEAALDNIWDFLSDTVSADITLYAKWGTQVYSIGNSGPGGGKIFYVSSGGFGPDQAWHYLEVAPKDSYSYRWSTSTIVESNNIGTSTGIGYGKRNTELILAKDKTAPAAKYCDDYTNSGKSDWFLPSKDELNELFKVRNVVGGVKSNYYWSSSEYGTSQAWEQEYDGSQTTPYRAKASGVYPVRAF